MLIYYTTESKGKMQAFTQDLAEEFVRTWQQSTNIQQVEEKLKIPRKQIEYRRKKLKALGVNLKKLQSISFKRNRKQLDVMRLNILAEVAIATKCPE